MSEVQKITELFTRMGAAPQQGVAMATQLLKRAEQLVKERGCSRIEAVEYLVSLAISGAKGTPPPGFEGAEPTGLDGAWNAARPHDSVDGGGGAGSTEPHDASSLGDLISRYLRSDADRNLPCARSSGIHR